MARRSSQPGNGSVGDATGLEELARWLDEGYATSFRTAYFILGNRADAEEAVQEAFLRAWRFRDSLSSGSDFKRWLYRVVVNTCNSKLRVEIPHRDHRASDDHLGAVSTGVDDQGRVALTHDVERALLDLPVHLRVVICLLYTSDAADE